MGGKALKTLQSIRLNQNEFYTLQSEVLEKLKSLNREILPIKSYLNKKDFGDLDILVAKPKPDFKELKNFLELEFNSKEVVNNNSIVSFEFKNFQVDLIFESLENIEIAEFYFSYNDLNNLIGKIAHAFGLKFGFTGLYYPLRTKHGNLSEEVLLTKNPQRIYSFLKYDFNTYLKGFYELEDIFSFVSSSYYFNPNKYLTEKEDKSAIDKTREKKRKTYIQFLAWLENNIKKEKNYFEFNSNKEVYLDFIANYFSEVDLPSKIKNFKKEQALQEEVTRKFNGKVVMSLIPSLNGKELGEFIINFKNIVSKESKKSFEEIIINYDENEINQKILAFWNNKNAL